MPITTTQGTVSVGRDVTLILIGPNGVRVDLANMVGFDSKQETATIKVDRLDGVQIHAELPKGWSGSFETERGNPAIDNLFARIEQDWTSNGIYNQGQIIQYIIEADQSQSTYAYTNVSFKYSDAGSWKGDATVKQKIEWNAWRRTPQ